jgi:hypothetical protein
MTDWSTDPFADRHGGKPNDHANGHRQQSQGFCEVCRNVTRNGAHFCSDACRQKAYRNRKQTKGADKGFARNENGYFQPRLELDGLVDGIALGGTYFARNTTGQLVDQEGNLLDLKKVFKEPGPEDGYKFELFDPTRLLGKAIPQRQWLVPGWIPLKRVVGLYGEPGTNKTTLAQMLATACALGVDWFPGLPALKCGSILLFAEDDLEDAWIRQEAINRHYRCSYSDLGAMRWLPRLGEDNALMEFRDGGAALTRLYEDLRRATLDHLAQLIVTDTLADVYVDNENDRAKVITFGRRALGQLALETGACMMSLAHPSVRGIHDGTGESGSTGWKGIFRSHLYLETPQPEHDDADPEAGAPPEDPDRRTLARKKSNYSRRDETLELRWDDGVLKAVTVTATGTGILANMIRRSCKRVALELFPKIEAEGRTVSPNSKAGNYAAKIFAARPRDERDGFKAKDFALAIEALLSERVLRVDQCTRSGHRSEQLIRGPKFLQPGME